MHGPHWGIENKLHWMLDVAFNKDQSRKGARKTTQNFSLISRIALSLFKSDQPSKRSIKTKRKNSVGKNYVIKLLKF